MGGGTVAGRKAEALIEAGVPERLFGKTPSTQPKSPLTPLYKGGEGEGEKDHRLEDKDQQAGSLCYRG